MYNLKSSIIIIINAGLDPSCNLIVYYNYHATTVIYMYIVLVEFMI